MFNTYGAFSGKTLAVLDKWVSEKGFKVVAGHSLHTPENFPPMIAKGRDYENSPNENELSEFNRFIADFDVLVGLHKEKDMPKIKPKTGFISKLLPMFSRTKARNDMGEKFVDETRCTECGICKKFCPYDAIILNLKPVFDMTKCYGCWSCYNHCPTKAIFTRKFCDIGHYPKPIKQLKEKLK